MTRRERIRSFASLGDYIGERKEQLRASVRQSAVSNPWFTEENIYFALDAIKTQYLDADALDEWTEGIKDRPEEVRDVGLILAGNIPLVGFHDVLTTMISGHRAIIKCSSKDAYLIPHLLNQLSRIAPDFSTKFQLVDVLNKYDAVIATGSNHTAEHFERYFSDVPHIIRRNRQAVAVISGQEDDETLRAYGEDVFRHFGMGCRNVSKLYLPEDFELKRLINAFEPWQNIVHHEKYKHNFDYNLSTYIINGNPHIATDFVVLLPNSSILSRIGTIHYEQYQDLEQVQADLTAQRDQIQCISTPLKLNGLPTVPPGTTQRPRLTDYADGINALKFLQEL